MKRCTSDVGFSSLVLLDVPLFGYPLKDHPAKVVQNVRDQGELARVKGKGMSLQEELGTLSKTLSKLKRQPDKLVEGKWVNLNDYLQSFDSLIQSPCLVKLVADLVDPGDIVIPGQALVLPDMLVNKFQLLQPVLQLVVDLLLHHHYEDSSPI